VARIQAVRVAGRQRPAAQALQPRVGVDALHQPVGQPGKTTLTEKLLLEGGAIHLAGEVKARGANRRARSDWMKIEQQRGI
jgi:hypothetical protein